jgi:hypothetical protein
MPDQKSNAEAALQNAAKNNPYFNSQSVRRLIDNSNRIHRITGIDYIMILQTVSCLVLLGRKPDQIQKIIETASKTTDFSNAVNRLSWG